MPDSFVPAETAKLPDFLDSLDEEASDWLGNWNKNWDRNIAQFRGDQWPADLRKKPMFLANVIAPILERKAGLLTESKPAIDIKVRKPGLDSTAEVLRKTIEAGWDEQQIPMALEDIASAMQAVGNGFIAIEWDANAGFGDGDIVISARDPRLMKVDPAVTRSYQLDKAQYIIEESVVPLAWIRSNPMFKDNKNVEPDTRLDYAPERDGQSSKKLTWFQRVMGSKFFNRADKLNAIPRVWLRKYWIADPAAKQDGSLRYPGGRLIYRTGDEHVVFDKANPYWDGLWPYEMLDNKPDMDHPFGRSEAEALIKIQETFNRTGHTAIQTLVRNLDWVVADSNALQPEVIQQLKNLEAVVLEKALGREVNRIPATQPTQVNIEFMRFMVWLSEVLSGLQEGGLGGGKSRNEIRGLPQLEGLQQAAQVLVRAQARRLEAMLERLGQKYISRIFQYYTTNRMLIYSDDKAIKTYEFEGNKLRSQIVEEAHKEAQSREMRELQEEAEETGKSLIKLVGRLERSPTSATQDEIAEAMRQAWKKFRFKIIPFSSLASTKLQRAAMIREMAMEGLLPASMVLKEAGFENPEQLVEQAAKELKHRQELGLPMPQPKKVGGGRARAA